MDLKELIGRDLAGYSVQEMHEVFKTDDDGMKSKSIGYFRSEDIATAFAGNQVDAAWHRVAKAFVLTNGAEGFLLTGTSVTLLSDEQARLDIGKAARAKLTVAEQRALGLL